jgi:hypothetical protein
MKKRLTLLLTDEQIHDIKVKAAMAGMPVNQWIIEQLMNIDTVVDAVAAPVAAADDTAHVDAAQEIQPDPEPVEQIQGPAQDAAQGDQTDPAADVQEIQPDPVTDAAALDVLVPDCSGRKIDLVERDRILLALDDALPGPENAKTRVKILRSKKVPVSVSPPSRYGGAWDVKKVSNNTRLAKKREAEREAAQAPAE